MSSTYTKGRRCGVDNCRSRYYQVINGQRVCRYGHVQEGELEVGSDDDDYFSQGRRLVSQKDTEQSVIDNNDKIFYGNVGNALFIQCIQLLIRKQVEWLIENQGVPQQLEQVVKQLFALYINDTSFASSQVGEKHDQEKNEIRSAPKTTIHDVEHDDADEDEDEDEDADEGDESRKSSRSQSPQPPPLVPEKVQLIDTILIVYLGCVLLRIPIYLYDLNRWIYRYQIPYMNAMQFVPYEMRKRLAPGYHAILTPRSPPIDGSLHTFLVQLMKRFKTNNGLNFAKPIYQPLLFKTIHDLLLPPEIYMAVELMIEKLDLDLDYRLDSTKRLMIDEAPEVRLVSLVVIAAKLCFGLDESVARSESNDKPGVYQLDWKMWNDMLCKLWVEDESLSEADERDVLYWDPQKIDRYLTWFEENFINQSDEDQPTIRKRLLDLFPLGTYDVNTGQPAPPPPTRRRSRRESISVIPVPGTVTEILKTVHKTTQEILYNGTEHPFGAKYQSYQNAANLPPLIKTLYQAAARLTAVRLDVIQQTCRKLEIQLSKLRRR